MSSQLAETRTVHFARLKSSFCFRKINKFDRDFFFGKYLTIIGRVWAKYGDLSVVSRSIIIIYLLIFETLTNHVIFGYPSSIIVLSFDRQVCFLMNIFGKRSDLPFFTQEWSQNTRHSWTTLRMSRTLFVGSYFQVTWWTFGQWKGRKICKEW